MTIKLGDDGDQIEVAPSSPLANLRARRQEILESAHLDLPVPRWDDPAIVVRYKPLDHGLIRKAYKASEKSKEADAEVNAYADLLIKSCVGVFAVLDGKRYSLDPEHPDGQWTRFDEALAANLGVEQPTARKVCRALFITDGDLISAANEVIQFSGYRQAEADEEFEGE